MRRPAGAVASASQVAQGGRMRPIHSPQPNRTAHPPGYITSPWSIRTFRVPCGAVPARRLCAGRRRRHRLQIDQCCQCRSVLARSAPADQVVRSFTRQRGHLGSGRSLAPAHSFGYRIGVHHASTCGRAGSGSPASSSKSTSLPPLTSSACYPALVTKELRRW